MQWYEVDFNRPTLISRTSVMWPESVGDEAMVYTMDDNPPFGFRAKVTKVERGLLTFEPDYSTRYEFLPRPDVSE